MTVPGRLLAYRLEPETLRRVYPAPDVVRARIDEVTAGLTPLDSMRSPMPAGEVELRAELTAMHLAEGDILRASAANSVAKIRADELPGRKRVDRAVKRRAKHIARLGLGEIMQAQQRYVITNLLFVELLAVAEEFEPEIEALTHLGAALNDFEQRIWDDARDHFEQALLLAAVPEPFPELMAAARTGLKAARERSRAHAA